MRVLIGVDGSPESFLAVQFTSRLLAASKDEVILYYSPPPVWIREVPDASGTVGAVQSFLANAVFEKARQHLPEGLQRNVQTIVGTHEPRSGLLIAADDRHVDLIAIGARGAGPLKAASIGAIARHTVHHTTIPVLVVRGRPISGTEPIRVLLASDGTEISKHAAAILQLLSWPADSTGRIITVIEPAAQGHMPGWLVEQLDEEQLAALGIGRMERDETHESRMRQEVLRWCGTLPPIFECGATLVVVGHAGKEILQAADMNKTNLIVLGARKLGTVRRALLGSTSEQVLTHATCSVLIVPEHEKP
jgi:nucleotide-binding universal stress UspA family protein